MKSYLNSKVVAGMSKTSGKGLFAKEKIFKGELIANYSQGLGKFINTKKADELFAQGQDHMIQVEDDLFFAATDESEFETADMINHSCDPNSGIKNRLAIIAMRDIIPGEEITFDYAMSESSDFEIKCSCGSANCRKLITGNDWMRQDLQKRYRGYFSDYLVIRIK